MDSVAASLTPRSVTVDVTLVAAVVESPTTIGVAESNLYTLSAQDLDRQLQVLKDAGVTDIRIGVPWPYIQPNSSVEYDWTKMDAVIEAVSITASITGNPAWDGVPIAGAPNAEVLKEAYSAIKTADPEAVVVGGVLGAVRTIPGVAMAPEEFLARMYDAGAGGYFDALSYHPYHYTVPFSRGLGVQDSPMNQVLALRALMVANGDEDLKIWATEYGVPATPFFGLSQSQQADFMRDFIAAWQSIDGAGPAFLYSGHDLDTGAWDNEANFGLWDENWNPKKFAAMLAEVQQQLDEGTFDTSFRAGGISAAHEAFIQVASLVLGLVNTALIIPRSIGASLSQLARQVVTTLANALRDTIRTIQGWFVPRSASGVTDAGVADVDMTGTGGEPEDDDVVGAMSVEDDEGPAGRPADRRSRRGQRNGQRPRRAGR